MSTRRVPSMRTKLLDAYRREWPRVAAVQAMVLGGASALAGRKSLTNLHGAVIPAI